MAEKRRALRRARRRSPRRCSCRCAPMPTTLKALALARGHRPVRRPFPHARRTARPALAPSRARTSRVPLREHLRLLLATAAERVAERRSERARPPSPPRRINCSRPSISSAAADGVSPKPDRRGCGPWSRSFSDCSKGAGFSHLHDADRALLAAARPGRRFSRSCSSPASTPCTGRSGRCSKPPCARAESATVCLTDPRAEAEDLDAAWVGTWEETFGAAQPIAADIASPLTDVLRLPDTAASAHGARPSPRASRLSSSGEDTAEQARAIVAQALQFLADPACERLGVLFPAAGALSRRVAALLAELDVPHHDGLAHHAPGPLEDAAWPAWLALQENPRLPALLRVSPGAAGGTVRRAAARRGRGRTCSASIRNCCSTISPSSPTYPRAPSAPPSRARARRGAATRSRFCPSAPARGDASSAPARIFRAARLDAARGGTATPRRRLARRADARRSRAAPGCAGWAKRSISWRAERAPAGGHPYSRLHLLPYAQAESQSVDASHRRRPQRRPVAARARGRRVSRRGGNRRAQPPPRARSMRAPPRRAGRAKATSPCSPARPSASARRSGARSPPAVFQHARIRDRRRGRERAASRRSRARTAVQPRRIFHAPLFLRPRTRRRAGHDDCAAPRRPPAGSMPSGLWQPPRQTSTAVQPTRRAYDARRTAGAAVWRIRICAAHAAASRRCVSPPSAGKTRSPRPRAGLDRTRCSASAASGAMTKRRGRWRTGNWVHDWLRAIAGAGRAQTFTPLPAPAELRRPRPRRRVRVSRTRRRRPRDAAARAAGLVGIRLGTGAAARRAARRERRRRRRAHARSPRSGRSPTSPSRSDGGALHVRGRIDLLLATARLARRGCVDRRLQDRQPEAAPRERSRRRRRRAARALRAGPARGGRARSRRSACSRRRGARRRRSSRSPISTRSTACGAAFCDMQETGVFGMRGALREEFGLPRRLPARHARHRRGNARGKMGAHASRISRARRRSR